MSVPEASPHPMTNIRGIPRTVVALGLVSLFMDISSEMIHSLLPVFLVTALGASALSVGLIEGIAEAATPITKLFSGAISDWIGKRKPLVLLGYGLAAATKPLFPLASGVGAVFTARFVDRIGKGIRGAPRDALIGDVTPVELRGTAFGLRQTMDTVGAFVGPLLAMLIMAASSDDFRLVFWFAVVPAIVSVLLILYGVQEPVLPRATERRPFPIQPSELRRLDLAYWWLVGIATILTLGRVPAARRRARRAGRSPHPERARHDECDLRGKCLSVWSAIGRCKPPNAAGARSDFPDSGGYGAGDGWNTMAGLCRRAPLGPAHGRDTRSVVYPRCRCGTRQSARHRARDIQSDNRHGFSRGERSGRFAMDGVRSRSNFRCRGCIRGNRPSRYAVLAIGDVPMLPSEVGSGVTDPLVFTNAGGLLPEPVYSSSAAFRGHRS